MVLGGSRRKVVSPAGLKCKIRPLKYALYYNNIIIFRVFQFIWFFIYYLTIKLQYLRPKKSIQSYVFLNIKYSYILYFYIKNDQTCTYKQKIVECAKYATKHFKCVHALLRNKFLCYSAIF